MQFGRWNITIVSGGRFVSDGGAMFGVVPKSLWSRAFPCDDENKIAQDTNCLLLQDGRRTVLFDTGYGGKLAEKQRRWMAADAGDPLIASLARAGVAPSDVTDVVLTHLHYDHVGGATQCDQQQPPRPTFPQATHYVQRGEWETAVADPEELRGAYPQENIVPLREAAERQQLELCLLEGDQEILPQIHTLRTPGHTANHQSLLVRDGQRTLCYLGDLCPTTRHFPLLWCMAFDVSLLDTRRTKQRVLAAAADERWLLVLDHDPQQRAAFVRRDSRKGFATDTHFSSLEEVEY
jgi:glyoxylase-like metal-dependent hydrolase (beta-lactamase superfamily II)